MRNIMETLFYKKNITVDFLNHKRKANKGQAQKFMVDENHPPIIDKEMFDNMIHTPSSLMEMTPCVNARGFKNNVYQ